MLLPGVEEIHDLRTAIRRFRVASGLLPKSLRKEQRAVEYISACRRLFKATTRTRDMDIIGERIAAYSDGGVQAEFSRLTAKRRAADIRTIQMHGKSLRLICPPAISSGRINRKKLNRRVDRILKGLTASCDDRLREVAGDMDNTEALHALRKNVKRLRYVLELFPENRKIAGKLKNFTEWQRVLGSIRDIDITIDYLDRENVVSGADRIRKKAMRDRDLKCKAFLNLAGGGSAIDVIRPTPSARQRSVQ
jgi:CHAD domain-containing protein